MDDIYQLQERFIYTLHVALAKKGISQRNLAESVKISQKTMNNYFTGKTFPDIISLLCICEYLEIDLLQLLNLNAYNNDYFYIKNKQEYQVIQCLRKMNADKQKKFVKGILMLSQCFEEEDIKQHQLEKG